MKEIATSCSELVSLNIANLENVGRVAFRVFYFLSNLQTLDISNNRNIDAADMETVGTLTKLVTLNLKNCTRVRFPPQLSPCVFITLISTHRQRIGSMTQRMQVDDSCLLHMAGMVLLEHIDISNCLLIGAELFQFFSVHRKLHTIIFSGLSSVNEDLCFKIAEYSHMKHVDVSYCPQATSNGLMRILQNCFHLTCFNSSGTETLTSTGVLRSSSTSLCTLAINGCAAVTNMSIMRLVTRNTNLQRLELDGIPTINDAAINLVAGTLKRLQVLGVSGTAVTEASVSSVSSRCPELDQLRVVGCSGITSKFAELMTKFMPWIDVLAGDPDRVGYGNGDDFEDSFSGSGSRSSQGDASRPISAASQVDSARAMQQLKGGKSGRPLTSGSVRFVDEGKVLQPPGL